jgi:hypothetical protein
VAATVRLGGEMAAIVAVAVEVDAPTATGALARPEVGAAYKRHTYRLPQARTRAAAMAERPNERTAKVKPEESESERKGAGHLAATTARAKPAESHPNSGLSSINAGFTVR